MDLGALVANWRLFANLSPTVETAAVVKADAYGLGAYHCAQALAKAGARVFFVATGGEALELRGALGRSAEIYVLNGALGQDHTLFVNAGLMPVISTAAQWRAWGEAGPYAVQIDTGMNRLGMAAGEAREIAAAGATPKLVMSHLACASDPAHPLNAAQLQRFRGLLGLFPGAALSLSSSAGALISKAYLFDLIRIGIGLYGAAPLDEGGPKLQTVARFSAPVLQVAEIAAGEIVGYGQTFVAARATRIATIGAGYADGVLRSLSGCGTAVVNGRRAAFAGRVSMDLITLDVTGIDVAEGDEAELIGPAMPVEEVARAAGTASYEVLTGLARAARRYHGGP